MSGYTYDSAGDLTNDGLGNTYSYNIDGTLATTENAQYTYDALEQRVEKTGGSDPAEFVYFDGRPVAMLNPTSGAWTDLIWAGNGMIAEVAGSESAAPVYRLLDHENSLAATADGSGNITGTIVYTPYGEILASNTNDAYTYAGLYQDQEYGGYHAWYRNFSTEQIRWITPDPYNGSYDLNNPQSFNRYSYVNGNPLGFVDPSGLAGAGIFTGIGGSVCKIDKGFKGIPIYGGLYINPCNPVGSAIADGVIAASAYAMSLNSGDSIASLIGAEGTWTGAGQMIAQIGAVVGAAITIGCSIDSNSAMCGQTGWTGALIGGDAGKVVGDSIAVAEAVACVAAPGPGCLADAIYTIANDVFSIFWDLFGTPQFKGSLLPRPSDLGGLGTTAIGIPNRNLTVRELLGSHSTSTVPSPGIAHP